MTQADDRIKKSALAMTILGWSVLVAPVAAFLYPPGILWGAAPELPSLGPAHPESHLHGLHPYLFMMLSLYVAWAILLIRGARDPRANAALLDWGILANVLHAALMAPMSFLYPNELAHLWTDVPLLLVIAAICWVYHPNRALAQP